jgi:Rod binding domain-containing protein
MSNHSRIAKWRLKQREKGKKPIQMWLTENEQFYIERVLKQMRKTNSVPCTMRNAQGHFEHLDV